MKNPKGSMLAELVGVTYEDPKGSMLAELVGVTYEDH